MNNLEVQKHYLISLIMESLQPSIVTRISFLLQQQMSLTHYQCSCNFKNNKGEKVCTSYIYLDTAVIFIWIYLVKRID